MKRRLPVVVHVNGHWAHKKGEDRLQLRAAFCALQGYIAVVVDSPGWSFEGNCLIERRAEGNHNDWFMFLLQAHSFLRKSHVSSVVVNYTEEWHQGGKDLLAHEYKLMTPAEADEANGREH